MQALQEWQVRQRTGGVKALVVRHEAPLSGAVGHRVAMSPCRCTATRGTGSCTACGTQRRRCARSSPTRALRSTTCAARSAPLIISSTVRLLHAQGQPVSAPPCDRCHRLQAELPCEATPSSSRHRRTTSSRSRSSRSSRSPSSRASSSSRCSRSSRACTSSCRRRCSGGRPPCSRRPCRCSSRSRSSRLHICSHGRAMPLLCRSCH